MIAILAALLLIFAECSLLAVGGTTPVLPEMQLQVTSVHRWMGAAEFAELYALAQAATGPNMMVTTLVGWRVGGTVGAIVATLAFIGPSSTLCWAVSSAWHRFRDAPWRRTVQAGLTPVTVGLVLAGAAALAGATTTGVGAALVTAAVAAVLLTTAVHPLWLLAAGAALGACGLV